MIRMQGGYPVELVHAAAMVAKSGCKVVVALSKSMLRLWLQGQNVGQDTAAGLPKGNLT